MIIQESVSDSLTCPHTGTIADQMHRIGLSFGGWNGKQLTCRHCGEIGGTSSVTHAKSCPLGTGNQRFYTELYNSGVVFRKVGYTDIRELYCHDDGTTSYYYLRCEHVGWRMDAREELICDAQHDEIHPPSYDEPVLSLEQQVQLMQQQILQLQHTMQHLQEVVMMQQCLLHRVLRT